MSARRHLIALSANSPVGVRDQRGSLLLKRGNQSGCKPGFVPLVCAGRYGAAVSVIYLRRVSPHVSIVLPSNAPCGLGRAALYVRWFTRTFSLRGAQPDASPLGWWALTPPSHPYRSTMGRAAVVFFCTDRPLRAPSR